MANLNETALGLPAAHIKSPKNSDLAMASRWVVLSGDASLIATFLVGDQMVYLLSQVSEATAKYIAEFSAN